MQSEIVQIRIHPADLVELRTQAAQLRLPLSSYLRMRLLQREALQS